MVGFSPTRLISCKLVVQVGGGLEPILCVFLPPHRHNNMASHAGFEPAPNALEERYSIQLS